MPLGVATKAITEWWNWYLFCPTKATEWLN